MSENDKQGNNQKQEHGKDQISPKSEEEKSDGRSIYIIFINV